MTATSFSLKWLQSEHNGGSRIIEYIVEIQEENTKKWTKVGGTRDELTELAIPNLKTKTGYYFRITARNAVGKSDPFCPDEKIVAGQRISKYKLCNVYYIKHYTEMFYISGLKFFANLTLYFFIYISLIFFNAFSLLYLMLHFFLASTLGSKLTEGALYALLGIFPRTKLSGVCKYLMLSLPFFLPTEKVLLIYK